MSKKIVVIEDDDSTVNLLEMWLNNLGYDVRCFKDGFEGLKGAREEQPDLVLLDVGLPRMNGYKICRLLKFDAKYKHIPVIMLTSQELHEKVQLGRDTGADEYVFKSKCKEMLPQLIAKYLG